MVFCGIITATILAGILYYVFARNPERPRQFANVYTQPGRFYWLKVMTFYLILTIRKYKDSRNKNQKKDHTRLETYNSGYGTSSKNCPEDMDKLQPLSSHPKAIDAVYFCGANQDGFFVVAATARRPRGVVNGIFVIIIPGLGTLVLPRMPDTLLFGGSDEYFGAEGFQFEPVVPMKHWKLRYTGELRSLEDPSRTYKVNFVADWKTTLPYFDYDNMIPSWTMARALALEPWTREYFNHLKETHQTHYEQHGNIIGKIQVENKTYVFDMPSMRDHSYGVKREWRNLHRYMMHSFITVDGRRFGNIAICHPKTSSLLELGYMYESDGTMHPVEWIDLPLWNHGEGGTPPTDYGYTLKANGKVHYIQVLVQDTVPLHIGWEWEAQLIERRCKFFVDGIEGYGMCECQYNYYGGRPDKYFEGDPAWTKDLVKDE